MDGTNTLDTIWNALADLGEERPTQDELIHLLAQLDGANLLATERLPDFGELSTARPPHPLRQAVAPARKPALPAHPAVRSRSLPGRDGRPGAPVLDRLGLPAVARRGRLGRHPRRPALERADPRPRRPRARARQPAHSRRHLPHPEAAARTRALLRGQDRWRLGARGRHHDPRRHAGALCRRQPRRRLHQQVAPSAGGRRGDADRAVLRRPGDDGLDQCRARPRPRRRIQLHADRRRLHPAVQRQPAAALRRLFHPVRPDRDPQPRLTRDPVLRLAGQPLRLRRPGPGLARSRRPARRHGSPSTASPLTSTASG